MNAARWRKVTAIFHAALETSDGERDAFVEDAAEGDPEIAEEVRLLLKADAEAGSYIEAPLVRTAALKAENSVQGAELVAGDVLSGRFRILRALGHGGMGSVFEAMDQELGVRIAVKVIQTEIAANPETMARFRQEVRLARQITHRHVCRTFDLGRDMIKPSDPCEEPGEVLFLTMEMLEGETLAARIKRQGALPLASAMEIAMQTADALEAARRIGIIHRDIKPANIMLVPDAHEAQGVRAVVTDFGLARIANHDGHVTASGGGSGGRVVGTLAYMAPEQLQGGEVSAATDVYAFGLVLYEMVTGQRAFPSDDLLAGISQRLGGDPPDPATRMPELPMNWRNTIQGCLRPIAAERFQDAKAAYKTLTGKSGGIVLGPGSNPFSSEQILSWLSRRKLLAGALLGGVAVALFVGVFRFENQETGGKVAAGALVYVAPVDNQTGNRTLGPLLPLVKAGLSQSIQIKLLGDDQVGDIVRQMKRSPNVAIDQPTGREIAMRAGADRVVFLTLKRKDRLNELDVEIQQPDSTPARFRNQWTKSFLWSSEQEPAGAIPQSLLTVLRQASDWIRHEAGESRNDIARLDVPPGDVTTSNWQALEEYAEAERLVTEMKRDEAVLALRNAVAIDPGFATAYGRLGDVLDSLGRQAEGLDAFQRALAAGLENRLSRKERDRIRGMFALDSGDEVAAEEAFRDYAMFYEHDYDGWFYRAYPLMMLGRTPEAIETLRRAYEINPQRLSAIAHLARYSMLLGNLPEAWKWQKVLADRGYQDEAHYVAAQLQMDKGQYDEAQQSFRAMLSSSNAFYRSIAESLLARYFAERGDLKTALEFTNAGLALDQQNGIPGLEAMKHVDRALLVCELKRTREIEPEIRSAKTLLPSPDLVIWASDALGRCGMENEGAKTMVVAALQELSAALVAAPNNVNATVAAFRVKGEELLATGRAKAAIVEFLKARQMEAPAIRPQYLARAYVAAAAKEANPILVKTYRDHAREIDHDIAAHQGDIWNSMHTLAPGFYSASLRSYLTKADLRTTDAAEEKQRLLVLYRALRGRDDLSGT